MEALPEGLLAQCLAIVGQRILDLRWHFGVNLPMHDAVHFELPPQGISLEAVEKELIWKALKKFDWNQTKAAAFLDISRMTLIYRMEKYGFHREAENVHTTV